MSGDLLTGLARLLGLLGTAPHPDALAAGLVEHLEGPLGARASAILAASANRMAILGLHGYEGTDVGELESVPLDRTYPVPRAFLDGEILIEDSRTMVTTYEGVRSLSSRSRELLDRRPDRRTASVPIVSRGRPIGGYSLLCDRDSWSTLDLSALDAIGHALGMWLTHPDSGLQDHEEVTAPFLTARQIGILSMVSRGMSNVAIAQALGISESTVKQELSRITRSLDADDRQSAVTRAIRLGILEDAAP